MSTWSAAEHEGNDRLVGILDEYLAQAAQGKVPDKRDFLARYPELGESLAACLSGLEWINDVHRRETSVEDIGPVDPAATLGDFQLLRELGRGGMGVVYEAEQCSLGRRVALKVLPFAAMLDARQKRRFQNEAHAAAQLSHPHIVDVIGVGCERGVHYYAMRLIDGPTLAEVITELRRNQQNGVKSQPTVHDSGLSTTSPRDYYRSVARLMADVAGALDYAHHAGVVHRDIKPSNILLDGRGNAWITDFGLARLETSPELTMTGDLLGTLRYMSPEQLLGNPAAVDQRTDIYSLGATLYELLTLRPVFETRDRAMLSRAIAVEPPRPPRKLAKGLPVELESIVHKALEKNPADRYRTAGDLAEDLNRFLDHRPIRARRSRTIAYAKSFWRRHQVLLVAVLTTLLAASCVERFRRPIAR